MGEEHFYNITKYHCQPYHDHGEWITTYDITKKTKKRVKLLRNEKLRQEAEEINDFANNRQVEELFRSVTSDLKIHVIKVDVTQKI